MGFDHCYQQIGSRLSLQTGAIQINRRGILQRSAISGRAARESLSSRAEKWYLVGHFGLGHLAHLVPILDE